MNNNIKRVRELRGLTQRELSEKTGISLDAIEFMESEKNIAFLEFATKIAKTLNVSFNDLFMKDNINHLYTASKLADVFSSIRKDRNLESLGDLANYETKKLSPKPIKRTATLPAKSSVHVRINEPINIKAPNNHYLYFENEQGNLTPCGEFNFDGFPMTPDLHEFYFKNAQGLKEKDLFVRANGQIFQVWPNYYLKYR